MISLLLANHLNSTYRIFNKSLKDSDRPGSNCEPFSWWEVAIQYHPLELLQTQTNIESDTVAYPILYSWCTGGILSQKQNSFINFLEKKFNIHINMWSVHILVHKYFELQKKLFKNALCFYLYHIRDSLFKTKLKLLCTKSTLWYV